MSFIGSFLSAGCQKVEGKPCEGRIDKKNHTKRYCQDHVSSNELEDSDSCCSDGRGNMDQLSIPAFRFDRISRPKAPNSFHASPHFQSEASSNAEDFRCEVSAEVEAAELRRMLHCRIRDPTRLFFH